ncbi:type V CRISPR-associated protein Cas12b [Chloracidobacterium thermophilum]|uniref:type V CRISPR-associated protein Cas12b n=1 Tax=Chloracidobacterium thermophilum TaxID=458033 RepID=UPI00073872A4|nr:type V CRISPR-associated protein Cas12b [Chloracidobacterium thermophilum]
MPQQAKPPVTQRAYTLRLRGADSNDPSWRDALWQTHEAVNRGAQAFGDWLLTLRGGLDHTLADTPVKGGKGKPDPDPTDEERKARRILLALSWLSVESKLGAPAGLIIAFGTEAAEERNRKVVAALEEILKSRGVDQNEINAWKKDCSASLSAAIRDDAVWVNRSKAFDEAVESIGSSGSSGSSLTREEPWDMLERFFGSRDAYLAPAKGSEDESSEAKQEDQAKDLVQKAGQWLSSRFGTGKGADFRRMATVYEAIAKWDGKASLEMAGDKAIADLATALSEFNPASNDLQGVLGLISGPGYKSATRNFLNQLAAQTTVTQQDFVSLKDKANNDAQECKQNTGSKGQRPYSNSILEKVESVCGFTYLQDGGPARHSEFAVILDHAARRVSLAHTWIKLAEAERRKFEEDAKKIDQVPEAAKDWLDRFCLERSGVSGALEPYRIRRRAVDGWKEVVAEWSKSDCKTVEDRIAAARALQDDPEIDKFGDIQLFEALAEDDAVCVWHKDGDAAKAPDPQPLIDYALAAEAEFKKRHFKVPAYRHPDALLHPIFCDFGKSRWDICFDVHKNMQTPFPRALCLTLWTGSEMKRIPLCWQSKRLARDLALGNNTGDAGASEVTRADRLGRAASRAASNVTKSDVVNIAGLFEQADWNGRLQAPRQQLEAIARYVEKHDWDQKAEKMRNAIQWLVTFSARLQPQGPWCAYAKIHGLKEDPQYWPHADTNKNRKGHARLILSRLPGLRVLAVDLGHRYAAACAVWEALSTEAFQREIKGRTILRGRTDGNALYCHTRHKANGKERVTIYRRIGADTLPDGKPHPAPWARLDRQFLIKLQGEEEGVREASNEEIWAVHQLEAALGRPVSLIDRLVASGWGGSDKQKARLEGLKQLGWDPADKPSLSVDELMSSAVRTMRLALKRHGDRARIAHYLITDEKTTPGGIKETLDEKGRIDLLQDALVLWHDLFSSRGWRDDTAKQLWNAHVAKLHGYKAPEEPGEDSSGAERKKKQRENREKLYDVAKALAQDVTLREALHDAWKKRWENDDERWKKQLRWFKDWVFPRGNHASDPTIRKRQLINPSGGNGRRGNHASDPTIRKRQLINPSGGNGRRGNHASDPTIRKVGGLSLPRLATLTEFRRKVQVGFFTRLKPDGTRAETKEQFGQSALDALEHLREQRVKQLASRIAEAALGVGRVRRPVEGKDPKRPDVRVDEPCHAIVIEDLTHYRPEETRTRRENRQLMTWSSSKVKKYLAEACQLHGLHLREVSASYTSRQDSRTGAPGVRCQDVPVKEFMRSPFWRKQVKQAEAKQAANKGDARERLLCDLNARWKDRTAADWEKAGAVRIPLQGGEIFVSADANSPAAKGIQADLNAAANIGLRALTDPDWAGKWWYVPCDPASFRPVRDKVDGSAVVNPDQPLRQSAQAQSGDAAKDKNGNKGAGKSKEVVNLWRDISSSPLECIEFGEWKEYAAYQNEVQCRVIRILKEQIKGRDKQPHEGSKEDDIPL